MEKYPKASNGRKPLPPLDLKVKERVRYWNSDRAVGVVLAAREGSLTEAMVLREVA